MAESNHRLFQDPAAARNVPTPLRDRADDPLAALARLIGQSVAMNDLARDARRPTAAGSRSAREFTPPAQHGYTAPDDFLQEMSAEQYSHPDAAQVHVEPSGAWYDEYEQQSHDHSDDHAYDADYDEDPNPRRRGRFIFVTAVFGLALLGTAGALAYRAPFAVPSLLSIIKAESGPNKIIATSSVSQASVSPRADAADNAGLNERLVSREERPVDVPASVGTAPQSVSTAAIISDPAPAAGPGPASQSPLTPLAQSPAARVDSLNSPTTAPAPPIPSANQAAAPAAPLPTSASPTTPGPKKVRTVSIQTDQPNAANSAASQSPSVAVPTTAQGAKSSARAAPPARSAPVGKATATKNASTSAAASSGAYAVQVLSQHNEKEVQSSFHELQAKYPKLLRGREPMVRRADLGAKGIYYRAMVGPFATAEQANHLCSNLKAAGGSCIVQTN